MSEPKKDQPKAGNPAHDLATRIYVELLRSNVQFEGGGVKMGADPAQIAAASCKLADAFYDAEEAYLISKAPKTTYKLEGNDIAAWMK